MEPDTEKNQYEANFADRLWKLSSCDIVPVQARECSPLPRLSGIGAAYRLLMPNLSMALIGRRDRPRSTFNFLFNSGVCIHYRRNRQHKFLVTFYVAFNYVVVFIGLKVTRRGLIIQHSQSV